MVEISPNQVAKAFFSVWLKHFNPFILSVFFSKYLPSFFPLPICYHFYSKRNWNSVSNSFTYFYKNVLFNRTSILWARQCGQLDYPIYSVQWTFFFFFFLNCNKIVNIRSAKATYTVCPASFWLSAGKLLQTLNSFWLRSKKTHTVTAKRWYYALCTFSTSVEEKKMMIFILVQATQMSIAGGKHVYTTKEEGPNNSEMPQAFVNNES